MAAVTQLVQPKRPNHGRMILIGFSTWAEHAAIGTAKVTRLDPCPILLGQEVRRVQHIIVLNPEIVWNHAAKLNASQSYLNRFSTRIAFISGGRSL